MVVAFIMIMTMIIIISVFGFVTDCRHNMVTLHRVYIHVSLALEARWVLVVLVVLGCYRLDVLARRILCTTYPIGFVLSMCMHVQCQCLQVVW